MEGKKEYKKGLWTEEEDTILMEHIRVHGKGRWNRVAKMTGLKRGGKSCRLRWINYLSPSVKRGDFSEDENDLIIRLHNLLGNRWSLIAGRVPGRTDNQVKNHWNTHLRKKLGVRREKRRILGLTSPPLNPLPLLSSPPSSSSEVVEKSITNVEEKKSSSNMSPFNNQKSIENNRKEEELFSSKEEMGVMNEDYDVNSSFWLINDYNINQDQQLHFMEFLDDSSPLDFLWPGL